MGPRVLLLVLAALPVFTFASRILLLPTAADSSHIFTLRAVHDELQRRGHESTFVILPSDAAKLAARDGSSNISHIAHKGPSLDLAHLVLEEGSKGNKPLIRAVWRIWHNTCDALLSDDVTMQRLQGERFDLIVGVGLYVCTPMLAAKLDLPTVNIIPNGVLPYSLMNLPWPGSGCETQMPVRLSYVTEIGVHSSHPMTFWQRMHNAYMFADMTVFHYMYMRPLSLALMRKHGVDLNTEQARQRSVLALFSADLALEQTRPLPPKIKLVGHIMAAPAKPLPSDMEAFVAGAGEAGVVLISLGTNAQFGHGEMHAMAAALARLPARVVWKVSSDELARAGGAASLNLSANVKTWPWVPQNDLLGHRDTRAFLTHCGSNGMYEAAFHGVPVLGLPHFGDQEMNALKAVSRGMGLHLFREQVTPEAVHGAVMRLLSEDSFWEAAQRVSRRLRSRKRTALQETADWVEHVLDTAGDPYLALPDEEMPWLVSHSVDVAAAWLCILLTALALAWAAVRAALQRLRCALSSSKHKLL